MKNSESASSGGVGFSGLLAIAFIVLKLCKVIAWSWLWVLSPLWIPLALILTTLIIWVAFKLPGIIKSGKKARRIRKLMRDKGCNILSATAEYNKEHGIKSRWEQRFELINKNK